MNAPRRRRGDVNPTKAPEQGLQGKSDSAFASKPSMNQAATATDDDAPAQEPAAVKKSIWPKILISLVLLSAAGGGGAWYLMQNKAAPVEEGAAAHVEKALYAPLEPAFVVNLSEDSINRYLQIDVQVMSHDQVSLDALEEDMPLIRNRLVLLFGAQKYDQINTREGKENLQKQALEEVRSVLKSAGVTAKIEAVYFTSFIIQ